MGDPEMNETRVHLELPELLFIPLVFAIGFFLRVENSDGTNPYLIEPRYNSKDDIVTLDSGWNSTIL